MMKDQNRRSFLTSSGALLTTGVVGSLGMSAFAAEEKTEGEHGSHLKSMKGIDAFVVDADEQGICATCRFWGGVRRVKEDKSAVHCESLGWCNNPDSHHYQRKTTPVTGPMESWRKWEAL